jgi:hypothetical protein
MLVVGAGCAEYGSILSRCDRDAASGRLSQTSPFRPSEVGFDTLSAANVLEAIEHVTVAGVLQHSPDREAHLLEEGKVELALAVVNTDVD